MIDVDIAWPLDPSHPPLESFSDTEPSAVELFGVGFCCRCIVSGDERGDDRFRTFDVCRFSAVTFGLDPEPDLDFSIPLRKGTSNSSVDLCVRLKLPDFEKIDVSALLLLLLYTWRETRRFDPGISEKDDLLLAPLAPPPIPAELEPLVPVPVDKSSVIGMDVSVLAGEVDNVGECCGFFFRRKTLYAPSQRLRGGVPHGEGDDIITESELCRA
mmetsp:Transcript_12107/g.28716  ORF Transcript_12107/g.28716 Transcript_12107/m.28716 type:complete len:214 (-) Transcript_12107:252-893(-)